MPHFFYQSDDVAAPNSLTFYDRDERKKLISALNFLISSEPILAAFNLLKFLHMRQKKLKLKIIIGKQAQIQASSFVS